jgi:hypothetical protein
VENTEGVIKKGCPVTIVVSSSELSFFDCPFGLLYSLTFICPVTIVLSSSGLSFFLTTMATEQINGGEYRRPKGQSKKDNPEELTIMVTGQINVREYRRPKGQSIFSNVYLSCDHCCQFL